jgi:hypothetical protein
MGDDEAEDQGAPPERAERGRLEHADLPVLPRQRAPLDDADG